MTNFRPCKLIPRSYGLILLVALAATVAGGWLMTRLKLESDLSQLLPESFPSVQALNEMRAEGIGGSSKLRVVLTGAEFPELVATAEALEERLPSSPYVSYAQYRNDRDFFERNALLFLSVQELDSLYDAIQSAIDEKKQELNPFMVEDLFGGGEEEESAGSDLDAWEARYEASLPKPYYTNDDSTVLVVEVFPSEESVDNAFGRAMLADVRRIVDETLRAEGETGIQAFFGGNIKNRIDEYETLKRDIFGTALYGITGVFLLLVLYFRSLSAPLLIATALAGSLTWTFGLTEVGIGQLNTITGFLFVVLFGMGIDYGIHAFARYRESRQSGMDQAGGLHKMVCETGRALGTTTLTTAAAFFSLMLMDFRGFSELGFITGVGLIFALVAMVMVLPGMVVGAEKIGLLRIRPVPSKQFGFERRPFRYPWAFLGVGAVVTALAVWGFAHVQFEYDFTDLRIITPERQRVGELTRGVFTVSESPAVVLADTPEEAAMVEEVVKAHMAGDTLTPTVDRVRSIYSFIPRDQEARLERIRRIRDLIQRENARDLLEGKDRERLDRLESYLAVNRPISLEDIPEDVLRPFRKGDGTLGSFVFIYPSVALRDGRNSIRFAEDIGTLELPDGKVVHAASPNIIIADLLRMVIKEGRRAILLSLAVVFLLLIWDFRSLRAAALVISPLLVGVVWMGGLMTLLGMKLNLFNMVVLPSVVGVGVDAGVHLYHRYLEEGPGSLYYVLRRTGPAVAMATVTTIVGYTGLMMASHPGLVSIGKLAVLALLTTLLSALTVFPAMIQVADPDAAPRHGRGTVHPAADHG